MSTTEQDFYCRYVAEIGGRPDLQDRSYHGERDVRASNADEAEAKVKAVFAAEYPDDKIVAITCMPFKP